MKDELKMFTEKNREEFELSALDLDEAWGSIEDKLNKLEKKTFWFPLWDIVKVAALFICVLLIGYGYYLNSQRISRSENGIALHSISSELADTEAFYMAQIDEKLELIELKSKEVSDEVLNQLTQLDEEYKSLKRDFNDNADSEEVINAMIEHYRLKLSMLEKILEEIKKNNDNDEVLAI